MKRAARVIIEKCVRHQLRFSLSHFTFYCSNTACMPARANAVLLVLQPPCEAAAQACLREGRGGRGRAGGGGGGGGDQAGSTASRATLAAVFGPGKLVKCRGHVAKAAARAGCMPSVLLEVDISLILAARIAMGAGTMLG